MSTAAADALEAALRLLELMRQEAAVLQVADAARIVETCREKSALLAQLASHPLPATGDPRRARLRELIGQCQARSRANDILLQARAKRVRGALNSLRGLPAGYDARGESRYSASGTLRGAA